MSSVNRRRLLIGGIAVPAAALMAGGGYRLFGGADTASAADSVLRAGDLKMPPGTPFRLVALPGKAPMGQTYDRPPNYETPAERLIGRENYPYTDNDYYYVRYREATVLQLNPDNYRLTIGGASAANEITLSLDDLQARATTTVGAVGMCSGEGRGLHHPMIPGMPWTKGDLSCAEWTGVRISDLLKEVGLKDDAKYASFGAGRELSLTKPEYWRTYPLASVQENPDAILAVKMNGEDIPLWNGYPVRLVVPGTWAPTWTKQLVSLEIAPTPHPMEWSGRPITPNKLSVFSMISTPTDGTRIPFGRKVEITGVAFDDGSGITKVEISQDDGRTWQPVTLDRSYGKYTWRVWRAQIGFSGRGEQRVLSRATSANGKVQPLEPDPEKLANGGRKETASRTFAAVYEVV